MQYTIGTRQVQVLRGVNLCVAAGTSVAIAGPSGSGKTSLLLLLSGLERPGAGRIRIDGTDLGSLGSDGLADLRRERVGIVFQRFHLLPSLSALDNAALPLQLSGGEQQRVATACCPARRPAARGAGGVQNSGARATCWRRCD